MELYDAALGRRAMSKHTAVVLALCAGVYLIGVAVLSPWGHAGGFSGAVATGSALSLDTRSAGFPLTSITDLSRAQQWLLIIFMLIGAAPAATSGGLNVTALFHAFRGTRRALKREPGLRITGVAATWIALYGVLVLLALLALLATLPDQPADRLVFLAASSVGTVGLSHEPVSVTGTGLYVLSLAMLLGRVAPLLVLWWAATTCDDADVGV